MGEPTAASELPPCDLVMKGGITSGLVYPELIIKLAQRYRFAGIGGTSAGAIAAGVAAAAEYGRQRRGTLELRGLDDVIRDLSDPDAMHELFRPTPRARPVFDLLWKQSQSTAPRSTRLREAAAALVRERPETGLLAIVLIAGVVTLCVGPFQFMPTWAAIVVVALMGAALVALIAAAAVGAAAALAGMQWVRAVRDAGFGTCTGLTLVEWLHHHIQHCAGRGDEDAPLTFGELEDAGIRLVMLTTDLSFARPVTVPGGLETYRFDPAQLRERFPAHIVEAMAPDGDERLRPMPTRDLPVVVGIRLSLSFPLLLSTVPLHHPRRDPDAPLEQHLLSDGGICSNFPVHFFDRWLPRHPTFAIDLAEHPADADAPYVFMETDPTAPLDPRWSAVDSFGSFAGTIKDAAQNWRDTLQSELPASRDRVCEVRFDKGQGGLYLGMDHETVQALLERGQMAGDLILKTFDEARWEQHRWIRYLTVMSELQENVHALGEPWAAFSAGLARGLPGVTIYRSGREAPWCTAAGTATDALIALGAAWGPSPADVDFHGPDGPLPEPSLRIVPRA